MQVLTVEQLEVVQAIEKCNIVIIQFEIRTVDNSNRPVVFIDTFQIIFRLNGNFKIGRENAQFLICFFDNFRQRRLDSGTI
jgi:hypothetical protein